MNNYICRVEWTVSEWDWFIMKAYDEKSAESKMRGRFPTARYISVYGTATILE